MRDTSAIFAIIPPAFVYVQATAFIFAEEEMIVGHGKRGLNGFFPFIHG